MTLILVSEALSDAPREPSVACVSGLSYILAEAREQPGAYRVWRFDARVRFEKHNT